MKKVEEQPMNHKAYNRLKMFVIISFVLLVIVIFISGCSNNSAEIVTDPPIIIEQEIVTETPIVPVTPEPEIVPHNIEVKYEEDILYIAKTVWGEARGCSKTEQAAVVWCILNRVDSELRYMPDTIIGVITQKSQFVGYKASYPVTDEIKSLVIDVLTRWEREKSGEKNVGRVLPLNYLYFTGDGKTNTFRTGHRSGEVWHWTLSSPYED